MIDLLQGLRSDIGLKQPVRVATTVSITLAGLQTIDGVTVADGDRVLVKNQSSAIDNGIYLATTSRWRRARDFDSNSEVMQGTLVLVNQGLINAVSLWRLTTSSVVFGTSTVDFAKVSGWGRNTVGDLRLIAAAALEWGADTNNERAWSFVATSVLQWLTNPAVGASFVAQATGMGFGTQANLADVDLPCSNYEHTPGSFYHGWSAPGGGTPTVYQGPAVSLDRMSYDTGPGVGTALDWDAALGGDPVGILASLDNGASQVLHRVLAVGAYARAGDVLSFPTSGTHRLRAWYQLAALSHSGTMTIGSYGGMRGYYQGLMGSYSLLSGQSITEFSYTNPTTFITFPQGAGPFGTNIRVTVSGYGTYALTYYQANTYLVNADPFNLLAGSGTRSVTAIENA